MKKKGRVVRRGPIVRHGSGRAAEAFETDVSIGSERRFNK